MQFYTGSTESERMSNYFQKTFYKTGSIVSCIFKAVAMTSNHPDKEDLSRLCFSLGKKLGMALQFINDVRDILVPERHSEPGSDLREGHATAPVLFACTEHPELNSLILRRFSEPGDVERTLELVVHRSQGVQKSIKLIETYVEEAKFLILQLEQTPYREALLGFCDSRLEAEAFKVKKA